MNKRIVCQKCIYYFVTWEPNKPHGCNKFGFKSKTLPSIVVKRSSNNACEYFMKKENRQ